MLEKLKLLLGITSTDKDNLLMVLIDQAKNDAKIKTGVEDLDLYDSVIIKMVIFNYNRLGTEGLESESYSGASYKYSSDYPEEILNLLEDMKKHSGAFGKLRTL